jgi:hypothetical protein
MRACQPGAHRWAHPICFSMHASCDKEGPDCYCRSCFGPELLGFLALDNRVRSGIVYQAWAFTFCPDEFSDKLLPAPVPAPRRQKHTQIHVGEQDGAGHNVALRIGNEMGVGYSYYLLGRTSKVTGTCKTEKHL